MSYNSDTLKILKKLNFRYGFSTYPKKKYDGVICTDVIEHIPESDVINFIDKLFNTLWNKIKINGG